MRKLIAAAWILGSSMALFALAAFLFGCCALPFHRVLHRAFPICPHAIGILSGHHETTPAVPTSSKRAPGIAKVLPAKLVRADLRDPSRDLLLSRVADNPRNVRTLGALRVDDDVGLHALFATFLI